MLSVPPDQRLLAHALDPEVEVAAGTILPPPEPVFRKFEAAKAAV
jgi:methionyl-tRNA synthetase